MREGRGYQRLQGWHKQDCDFLLWSDNYLHREKNPGTASGESRFNSIIFIFLSTTFICHIHVPNPSIK